MDILAYSLAVLGSLSLLAILCLVLARFFVAPMSKQYPEPVDLLVYTAPRDMVAAVDNHPVRLFEGDRIVEHKYGRTVVRWLDFDRLVETGEVVRHAEADDGDYYKGYRARSLFAIEAQQACD